MPLDLHSPATHAMAQGFALWLSLMVAIGPQNALVITQGIRRQYVGAAVAVCMISDVGLVVIGISGVGLLAQHFPWLVTVLGIAGVAFLLWFAWHSFADARHPEAIHAERGRSSRRAVLLSAMAVTWLNPMAMVDSFVMLGGIAHTMGEQRWFFGLGALGATLLWFPLIGFGAHALAGPLSRPRVWSAINVAMGVLMLLIALRITLHLLP